MDSEIDLGFLDVLVDGLGTPKVPKISFKEFIPKAWSIVEPATNFITNWHIDALADHLEAVSSRQIQDLLITIAPRSGKSLITSVFWPAWVWTFEPGEKFLCASYSSELSIEHSIYTRRIIQSDWYQKNWGALFRIVSDQNRKSYFQNDRSGYRHATSVGGIGTGFGGSTIIVDDPHNVKEAPSKAKREDVIKWWSQSMSTRLNNPQTGCRVVIQQRCHMNDLAGHIIQQGGNWVHLNIPAEYNPRKQTTTVIGWSDPREIEGELLWPMVYGKKELAKIKTELGGYGYNCQYQQEPSALTGGLIDRGWWKFYDASDIPKTPDGRWDFDNIIASWDLTFKSTDASDYVVGQVWGTVGANRFLLDQIRKKLTFPETIRHIKHFNDKWLPTATYVEDKANGPAVISVLRTEIPGLIAIDPQGDKAARIQAVSPQIEAGNVLLPRMASWVDDYIEEFAAATADGGGQYWDQIDATSQALLKLKSSNRKLTWGRNPKNSDTMPKGKLTFGRKFISVGRKFRGTS